MPLAPEAAEFLRQTAALNAPAVSTLPVAQSRAQVVEAPLPWPECGPIADRMIRGPGGALAVRCYRPAAAVAAIPAGVVFLHGGGWVLADVAKYERFCRELANASGCQVFSVEYRLAPEHKFPASVEDAYAALVWAAERSRELGVERVAICGDSAGGNLAAAVCLMAREHGGPPIAAQALLYPVADCDFETGSYREFAEGHLLTRDSMRWFFRQYLADPGQATHPWVSPLRAADLSGLPPALVVTCQYDVLRDEGDAYAGRLSAAGVAVERLPCPGQLHGFLRRPDVFPAAAPAIERVGGWLRATLCADRA